jgi:undecaprenyl-diphosphatase
LESLGVPLPGETALITAAAWAATGRLSIRSVVIVAAAAAIIGDNCGYWIGRTGGLRLIRRFGHVLHIHQEHLESARSFFDRHGAKTVFIGRFIAVLRTWAAVLAGVSSMPYAVFMMYNAAGGVIWAALFGTLGYTFGRNLPRLEHYIGQATLAFALLFALVVGLFFGARWFHANSGRLSVAVSRITARIGSSDAFRRFRQDHPQAWEFLIRRFAPGEYLGLHLTLGLIVSIAALGLFGAITEDVIHHDPLTQFDLALLDWFHHHSTSTGLRVFAAITWAGSPLVITTLGVIVLVMLAARRAWLLFSGWAAAYAGAGVLDTVLKHLIRRPRPVYASAFIHDSSFSFPSGHAMGSLIGYGMLAYIVLLFWAKRWQTTAVVISITALLVLAIGISRLYLGVHYFSDVVGGYAAGAIWLSACVTGLEIARQAQVRSNQQRITG